MKRISTKLYGRLGNQMFQIATAWAYAMDKGLEFILPNSTLNHKEWPFYWTGKNDIGVKRLMDFEGIPLEIIYKDLKPGFHPIPHYTDFIGQGFFNLITFDGYWQSYKYFDKYKSELIKLFKFGQADSTPNNMHEYVAIHIRRGDYVDHSDKFPPVTPEYIHSAIELFNGYHRYKFMIFSDDIQWCRINIKNTENNEICYYDNSGDDTTDQKVMYQCAGFIISNSTYSWWPAYLSTDKMVIAPKIWYGPGNAHIAHNDLLPETWITI